jgi:hypothetical protein
MCFCDPAEQLANRETIERLKRRRKLRPLLRALADDRVFRAGRPVLCRLAVAMGVSKKQVKAMLYNARQLVPAS